jgi:hypothetical protein
VVDYLLENYLFIYVLLGLAAVILGVLWWNTRKRGYLIGGVIAALLIVTYGAIRWNMESPSQQIERKIQEMADGVRKKELNKVFEYISEDFERKGATKQEFRRNVESVFSLYEQRI